MNRFLYGLLLTLTSIAANALDYIDTSEPEYIERDQTFAAAQGTSTCIVTQTSLIQDSLNTDDWMLLQEALLHAEDINDKELIIENYLNERNRPWSNH